MTLVPSPSLSPESLTASFIPPLLEPLLEHIPEGFKAQDSPPGTVSGAKGPDEEIEILQLALDAAKRRVSSLQQTLRLRRNHYALIHRLPIEIVSYIFQLAETARPTRSFPFNHQKNVPMNVSRVSKNWRNIALSTPRIWSHIDMADFSAARMFIERSKGAPLSISVVWESDICRLLLPHSRRWWQVKLRLRSDIRPAEFPSSLPALEALHITNNRGNKINGNDDTSRALKALISTDACPRLRELGFIGFFLFPALSSLSRLKKLSIRPAQLPPLLHSLIGVIRSCRHLEVLELSGILTLGSFDVSINLPLLRHVSFSDFAANYIMRRVLAGLTLRDRHAFLKLVANLGDEEDLASILPSSLANIPNILSTSHMQVRFNSNGCHLKGQTSQHNDLWEIRAMATGSDSSQRILSSIGTALPLPLESLSITSYTKSKWKSSTFAEMLDTYPALKELEFNDCHSKFIQTLARTPKSPLCPSLRKLILRGCSITEKNLLSLVKARTKGARPEARLERLEIINCPDLSDAAMATLGECLDVHLESGGGGTAITTESVLPR